ncbi:helix-turn-helix domain-containing protein [Halomonas sp. ISL-60]|uniref:helix-turn-helix transcriptional regulator n=1 Tax=Halomonas sp. ISL-56 TaxID=2819149 RepID=UPI001BE9E3D0|nr:helix-turn-helix transcriptional regulator [Halomonas sp. ISL-56]MBT2773022.1 helix-turn-helix domain-containing protein [Halomonas sp. ISL-60]MBT2800476.1 helix-turn-helix domain-containing protein [Halomonas sp. ISL-56]
MTAARTLTRTREDLAAFLRKHREKIAPEAVGLPRGRRRRTPGLRREEVAALAGVGLTWYTWLEQGRDISVSATFLDNLSKTLKLDAAERRHLFLLAHQRLPSELGKTWCSVPPLVQTLMDDLPTRPAYILNLRWDVLAWNAAADKLFNFSVHAPERRNMLWLLFTDPAMRLLLLPWEEQVCQMLSSFQRDFARATEDPAIDELVEELTKVAPEFKAWWKNQEVNAPCQGVRHLYLEALGVVAFEHTTLTVDEERHLRLVYYAHKGIDTEQRAFNEWVVG